MVTRVVLSTICDTREGSVEVGLSGRWFWMRFGIFVVARKNQSSKTVKEHIDY